MSYEVSLKQAMEHLQARYKFLSEQATQLVAIMKDSGPLPPMVQETFNLGVRDYLRYGRDLFDVLVEQGLEVQQVKYVNGVPDKTVVISAPLIPSPVLPGLYEPLAKDSVGALPAAIAVIGGFVVRVVSSKAAQLFAKWVVGGYITLKGLELINVTLHGYPPDYHPDKQTEAYLKAFDSLVKSGVSPTEAKEAALSAIKAPEPRSSVMPLVIAGIGLASVAYVFTQVYGSKHG